MLQTGQIHRSRRAVCHPDSGKVGDMIMAKIAEVHFGTVESDGTVGASRFPRWIYIKHPRDCFGSTGGVDISRSVSVSENYFYA